MKYILPLFVTLIFGFNQVHAQDLPKGLTSDEEKNLENYFQNYSSGRGITTAPTGTLRTMAEWEEIQSLVITWTGSYPGIQSQIVDAAQEECQLIIVCTDSTDAINDMGNNGVSPTNCRFIEAPFNSIWMRDYAANTVYKNDMDSLLLVDWIYNRPRPDDDVMPDLHAQLKNLPLYTTTLAPNDLVNTGGNFMVDGFGTAFASELILEENEPNNPYNVSVKTEQDIDNIMQDWMGIDRFIKMPILPYDGIHHIDMHMKLLDEETLLVSEYPQGVADGPQIEANLQYVLDNYNSVYGTPYKVVRITVPPSTSGAYPDNNGYYRTYTNSVFVNKTVIVPTYREEFDTTALRIYQEQLPGYKIVGIDVDDWPEALIASSGAIHCITNSIGVEDQLLISHQPLEDTYDDVNDYPVEALIKHNTGINGATLHWTTDTTAGYNSVVMTNTSGNDWTGNIPAHAAGSKIFYYIQATAQNGKTQVRPMPAPDGYWKFRVLQGTSVEAMENGGVAMDAIYPNPASAVTVVPVNAEKSTEARITLVDMLGKEVDVIHNGRIPMGQSNYFLHANQYESGAYMVIITTPTGRITQKLMVE